MKYPENERILIVRPCLKTICAGIRPAAKLLSLLLYKARNCSEKVPTYTFSCTQQDLVDDLIEEMDVKTLHRTAIPFLRLLGYLDVDGSSYRYTYTVHLDRIQHALTLISNSKQLEKCLIVWIEEQGEKFPEQIDFCPIQLDISPIQLDKLLIPFRQMSNSKRGRKTRPQEHLVASFEDDRLREIEEIERYDSSSPSSEQITEPFLVPTLPLRDEVSVHKSSYSHEPAESGWLCEIGGETDIFSEEDADPTEKRPVINKPGGVLPTHRQVGRDGITSVTFDEIVETQNKVQQGGNLAPKEGRALLESEDRREGSNEHPAVKPTGSRQPPASPGQAARMREQPTGQYNPHEKPRQPTRTPTDLSSEASKPPLPDKTGEKGNRKNGKNPTGTAALKATLTTEEWRRFKRWTSHYNARRGGEPHVDDKSRAVEETDIIKLIRKFSDERIEALDTRFFEKDPYWSKLENKYSVDGRVVWTRHQTVIPVLIEQGKWPRESGDIPMPAATPAQGNGKYHPYTRASMYEPIEIGV